jgi:cytochrome b561
MMSQAADEATYPRLVHLHTSIGMTAYALLWGRIVWRFAVGHPGPLAKQNVVFFTIGKYFHFVLLVAIGAMLVSGPLMVWTDGDPIRVFAVAIPSPWRKLPDVQHVLRSVHGYAGLFLAAGIALHVLAVFKHVALDRDGTFDKMMIADGGRRRRPSVAAATKAKA